MATAALRAAYHGPLKAVIFDFAGTIVDYGSIAPVIAFREVFRREGVVIDVPTARGPMGLGKREHITAILSRDHVSAAWKAKFGRDSNDSDIDRMYQAFTPIQIEAAVARADPIPGALDIIAMLRERGIRVGGCSGYNDEIMAAVVTAAKTKGLAVDHVECPKGANGRPKPWMAVKVAEALDAWPLYACVKVDDTVPGIFEGVHAGMWTVGVSRSGNELGMDLDEAAAAEREDPAGYKLKMEAARASLAAAGAHYVIDSVADLPEVLDHIAAALAEGKRP